jgi:hypothetical protein
MQGDGEYWPGWVSGVVLAGLIVAYFWITGRLVSSSGRVSVLMDRLRHGPQPTLDASREELAEALRLATIEAFGQSAVEASEQPKQQQGTAHERSASSEGSSEGSSKTRPRADVTWLGHLAFLIGIIIGGRVSRPTAPLVWTLGEGVWTGIVSDAALPYVLLFAGVLVGFGTRMAGGCPIGHGLCGMARGQAGSWASGLSFFAAGVALAFALGML